MSEIVTTANTDAPANYYPSRHSGEEIDNAVDMMGGGTSPANGLASLGAKSRLNLLVNEHFTENSRGQEKYTAAGYTVDEWRLNAATGTVTVLPHGIRFASTSTAQLSQWIAAAYDDLANHTLTVSGYIDNVLYTATATIPSAKPTAYTTFARVDIADNCFLAFSWSASSQKFEVRINFSAAGSMVISAAKLEFGDKSTLAYPSAVKAPNLAESLLENGDFMLNSLGKTEYSSAGITFDNWTLAKKSGSDFKVSAAAEGVRISKSNGFGYIKQALDPETVSGKTLNISMLAKGTGYIYALIMVNGASYGTGLVATKMTDDYTLYSVYRTLNSDLTAAELRVGTQESNPSGYVDIKAIKVELGDQSTLEPLVDKTIWTLVDQPDRPVEALRSACYYDGEWQGLIHGIGARPRDNLIINPLFKINQRGAKSANGEGQFLVDRWKIYRYVSGTASLTEDGIHLAGNFDFGETIESSRLPSTPNLVITISALFSDGSLASKTGTLRNNGESEILYTAVTQNANFYFARNWVSDCDLLYFNLVSESGIDLVAAKLELGPTQTLARQLEDGTWELLEQPDPLDLLKCQRYLWVSPGNSTYALLGLSVANNSTTASIWIDLPVPMRDGGAPSVSVDASKIMFRNTKAEYLVTSAVVDGASRGSKLLLRATGTFSAGTVYETYLGSGERMIVSREL